MKREPTVWDLELKQYERIDEHRRCHWPGWAANTAGYSFAWAVVICCVQWFAVATFRNRNQPLIELLSMSRNGVSRGV